MAADDDPEKLRPWADLCPDLLNLIYSNLSDQRDHRSDFGSVCKNWRRVYAAAAAAASSASLANVGHQTTLGNHTFTVRTRLDRRTLELESEIPTEIRDKIYGSYIVHMLPQTPGWWILRNQQGKIFGCFNPLIPWPSSFISLPELTINPYYKPGESPPLKISALFSSPPQTDSDDSWTLFVVRNRRRFSLFRRGQWWWRSYSFSTGRTPCVSAYSTSAKSFVVLFDTGDVLLVGDKEQRMLIATPPLAAGRIRFAGEILVGWDDYDGSRKEQLLRLVAKKGTEILTEDEIEVVSRDDRNAIKRVWGEGGGSGAGGAIDTVLHSLGFILCFFIAFLAYLISY